MLYDDDMSSAALNRTIYNNLFIHIIIKTPACIYSYKHQISAAYMHDGWTTEYKLQYGEHAHHIKAIASSPHQMM